MMLANISSPLPVVIAGAGPCGLLAALVLQRESTPFIVVEKATREKLYSDVGSAFDIAPTAIDILQNRLKLNVETTFTKYEGMCIQRVDGTTLRELTMGEMNYPYNY